MCADTAVGLHRTIGALVAAVVAEASMVAAPSRRAAHSVAASVDARPGELLAEARAAAAVERPVAAVVPAVVVS